MQRRDDSRTLSYKIDKTLETLFTRYFNLIVMLVGSGIAGFILHIMEVIP